MCMVRCAHSPSRTESPAPYANIDDQLLPGGTLLHPPLASVPPLQGFGLGFTPVRTPTGHMMTVKPSVDEATATVCMSTPTAFADASNEMRDAAIAIFNDCGIANVAQEGEGRGRCVTHCAGVS